MNYEKLNGRYAVRLWDEKGRMYDMQLAEFSEGANRFVVTFRRPTHVVFIAKASIGAIGEMTLAVPHKLNPGDLPEFRPGAIHVNLQQLGGSFGVTALTPWEN